MIRLKKRFLAMSLAAVMAFPLTACEPYDEWEARVESEQAEQETQEITKEQTVEQPVSTGPSLADYVNAGLKEAEENGLHKETDYSSIRIDGSSTGPAQGAPDTGNKQEQNDLEHNVLKDAELHEYLTQLEYKGEPFVYVNDNIPYFIDEDLSMTDTFEFYSELDELGRTQYAFASIDESLMPPDDEERGDISSVTPTGWVQKKYDGIGNGDWLYNRCHLIAWALAGENDNERNLMTGTRYFNVEGMLPFEMQALDYVDNNPKNHLLYRATPVYDEDDMLAKGLLLEAHSIEDEGELQFCVFVFNVQPDIRICYSTGDSKK